MRTIKSNPFVKTRHTLILVLEYIAPPPPQSFPIPPKHPAKAPPKAPLTELGREVELEKERIPPVVEYEVDAEHFKARPALLRLPQRRLLIKEFGVQYMRMERKWVGGGGRVQW